MRPVHPGEVLREEYLKPLGLSANALAEALRLSPSRIGDIVLERRVVTADTAVRLARYFGGAAQFWLNFELYTIFAQPSVLRNEARAARD
jgi:addiction module HigA family antidote